jgi:SAM-dependent methyltransferase
VTACPFCAAEAKRALKARDRNRETTDTQFFYDRCVDCGCIFLVNVPADLRRYYGGSYPAFRPDGEAAWQGNDLLLGVEADRLALLRRHVPPGVLIDIGAGAGAFSFAAARAGYDVSAIEMDQHCCQYLAERLGVHTICSDRPLEALGGLPRARVITMWHVLEHLPNPAQVLAAAAGRLEPGGILAIGVPNPDSLQFRLLRSRWAHLDAPRHLVLLPAPTLIGNTQALGLSCVELTTDDLFSRGCNLYGWTSALQRHPAVAVRSRVGRDRMIATLPRGLSKVAGRALTRLVRPIERRDLNGSALLMLLRRGTVS